MIRCNLCKHEFNENDVFINSRKKAHEEKHRRQKYHENDLGQSGSGHTTNNIIGIVEWIVK